MIRYAGNYRCLDGSFFRIAIKTRKDNKILISELKKIYRIYRIKREG